jgi:hypothetical protein
LQYIRDSVEDLKSDLDTDEVAPTAAAVRSCQAFVSQAMALVPIGLKFFRPHISTTGRGDLLCEWLGDGRDLVAYISSAGMIRLRKFTSNASAQQVAVVAPNSEQVMDAIIWFLESETTALATAA